MIGQRRLVDRRLRSGLRRLVSHRLQQRTREILSIRRQREIIVQQLGRAARQRRRVAPLAGENVENIDPIRRQPGQIFRAGLSFGGFIAALRLKSDTA